MQQKTILKVINSLLQFIKLFPTSIFAIHLNWRKNPLVIYYLITAFYISFGNVSIGYSAETIFRPGPGLNDGTDNGSLNAGKDAVGGDCNGPAINHGSSPNIYASPISNCNNCNSDAFIQFNLDTLPADVTHVYLGFTHLPHTAYCYSNCAADFYLYPISEDWNEMTIHLSNAPGYGAAIYEPIHINFPNDFGNREYEITDLYRQWKNGAIANYGIKIASTTVGCNNASVGFHVYSSDAVETDTRPYLRIVTADTPPSNLLFRDDFESP